ncbi:MAG: ABC transporter permease [Dehalococcoidales bacterium]
MGKIKTIFKRELLNTVKRKSFILVTVAFPLLGLLVIGGIGFFQSAEEGPVNDIRIGYVDEPGDFNGNLTYGNVTLVPQEDWQSAFDNMSNGLISQFFVIPRDYMANGNILRYTFSREVDVPYEVYNTIEMFLLNNILEGKVDSSIANRVAYPLFLSNFTLSSGGEVSDQQGGFASVIIPYIFSLLLVMAIFTSSGFLLQGLGEEKENRVMEILLSSVSSTQLITGKVLGLGCAGLIQIGVWLVSARILADMASTSIGGILSGLSIPTDYLIVSLIYFVTGYLLFAIIMAGAGSIGATARESQQFSTIFTLMAVVPFFFMIQILESPAGALAQFLTFFPITAPITVIMRMAVIDIPIWELGVSIAIMVAAIFGSILLAAKIFRTFLLMHGKTPKLGEIIKTLRQA